MSDQSDSIGSLVKALVNVQGEIKPAKKESENPFFHSKYADLGAVWESCRALLKANGLVVIQTTKVVGTDVVLVSTLAHVSGEWIKGELLLIPVKRDPQGIGSSISYARRYALAALLGIVSDEDDDGNAASMPQASRQPANQATGSHEPSGETFGKPSDDTHTSIFQVSEPMTSKKGTVYYRALDSEGSNFYVWDDSVCATLRVNEGKEVTVRLETKGKFTSIQAVLNF